MEAPRRALTEISAHVMLQDWQLRRPVCQRHPCATQLQCLASSGLQLSTCVVTVAVLE